MTFAEVIAGWGERCVMCGDPVDREDVKQCGVGHVMHWVCYDKFLEQQEQSPQRD